MTASPRLSSGVTYQLNIEGIDVLLTPPSGGWKLFTYQSGGESAGAWLGWRGPGGFRDGTLNFLFFDLGLDVADAWDRIELLGDSAAWGGWNWVDQGSTFVGDQPAEWREARTPDLPVGEDGPLSLSLVPGLGAEVWANSSVRFYVVSVDDLTMTVVAFENRCACLPNPLPEDAFGAWMADDTENELSMWLDELDAFLTGLSLEQS